MSVDKVDAELEGDVVFSKEEAEEGFKGRGGDAGIQYSVGDEDGIYGAED